MNITVMIKFALTLFLFIFNQIALAELSAQWTGVAGIYITDGHHSLFFDPVFNKPPLSSLAFNNPFKLDPKVTKSFLDKIEPSRIDAIFHTHTHFDHYADAPLIARKFKSIVYGSKTAKFLSLSSGVPKDQIKTFKDKDVFHYGDFKIEVISAVHGKIFQTFNYLPGELNKIAPSPINLWSYRLGGSFSFLITHKKKKILIQQSASPTPGLKGKKVDIIFQTIANRVTTKQLDEDIWKEVQPKLIIPVHQDNFFSPIEDFTSINYLYFARMKEFRKYMKKTSYKLIEPKYFEPIIL